eukprot:TRINITY_DN14437_c0_g1_i2.p1 TRINITY_DN14437_c0_g1~~TRINITY_DN14437_c0_g1_i2.p1  ORF type:complete len:181 (+),score=46.40 TRINITY_DN14437_c0_g1_i2:160-702(+)
MIKLFSVRQEAKKDSTGAKKGKKTAPGELRIQKDVSELELADTTTIDFPNGADDLMHIQVNLVPDEGMYQGAKLKFSLVVPPDYPHTPPKVHCDTLVYHPNIDLDGNVCLNILREEWKPILTLNHVIYGIQHLFLEPNDEDPLNTEAADLLAKDKRKFEQAVQRALNGGTVAGTRFPKLL